VVHDLVYALPSDVDRATGECDENVLPSWVLRIILPQRGRGTCSHLIVHGFDVPARTFGTHKVHLAKFYLVLVRLRSEATPSNDRNLQSDADGGQSLPLGLPGPVPYGETLFALSCRRTTHSSEMRRIATTDVVGR
jgi:hypothetical protein